MAENKGVIGPRTCIESCHGCLHFSLATIDAQEGALATQEPRGVVGLNLKSSLGQFGRLHRTVMSKRRAYTPLLSHLYSAT